MPLFSKSFKDTDSLEGSSDILDFGHICSNEWASHIDLKSFSSLSQ